MKHRIWNWIAFVSVSALFCLGVCPVAAQGVSSAGKGAGRWRAAGRQNRPAQASSWGSPGKHRWHKRSAWDTDTSGRRTRPSSAWNRRRQRGAGADTPWNDTSQRRAHAQASWHKDTVNTGGVRAPAPNTGRWRAQAAGLHAHRSGRWQRFGTQGKTTAKNHPRHRGAWKKSQENSQHKQGKRSKQNGDQTERSAGLDQIGK